MKPFCCLFCLLFLLGARLPGQTRKEVRLYGYARPVTGGLPPRISGREGHAHPSLDTHPRYNYLIYLESALKKPLTPVEIWIGGKRTGASFSLVAKTPIEITNGQLPPYARKTTLVPRTAHRVYQVNLAAAGPDQGFSVARSKAKEYELVVVYRYAGKLYYAGQRRIRVLEPVVLQ